MDHSKKRQKRRKNKQSSNNEQFKIDTSKIKTLGKTTLMIRNIPNKYTKKLFLEELNRVFEGKFDFFYLPIDQTYDCNIGYAFINFVNLDTIETFYWEYHGKRWERFNSKKVCMISYARLQGLEELVRSFINS